MLLLRALFIFTLLLSFNSELRAETVEYVEIQNIHPAQLRYSSKNVERKVKKAKKRGLAFRKEGSSNWSYAFNNGTSIIAPESALPIIKSPIGFVLIDGHHAILSSLALEATHVPIKEIADLSYLTEEEFWFEAEKHGWAYLYDLNGERHFPPKTFSKLQDDSNRYFAAIAARKYPADGNTEMATGLEYPLWIKVGKDIPFIEFMISDALWSAGFVYKYDTDYEQFIQLVEEARPILLKADIPGLRIVPEKIHYTDIDLANSNR